MQQLYRHFDKEGKLLYVGISMNALGRLIQHRDTADWFRNITTVTIEHYETRKDVLQAELQAIRTEKPVYNIHGNACVTLDVIRLVWKKPKYKVLGKLLIPEQYLPTYLDLLYKLSPNKRVYEMEATCINLKALKHLKECLLFKIVRSPIAGVMRTIERIDNEHLKIPLKVSIALKARDILIQAREEGDVWVEKEYKAKVYWYGSSWYIPEEVKGSKKVESIEFQGCGIGNKYK